VHDVRKTSREDQREVNNLPKLSKPQQQGRMLVIDEASSKKGSFMTKILVAKELVKLAKDLLAIDFPSQDALDKYLKEHPDADRSNHKVVKREHLRYDKKEALPDPSEMRDIWKDFWGEIPDAKKKKFQVQHGVKDSDAIKDYDDLPEKMRHRMEHRDLAASELVKIAKTLVGGGHSFFSEDLTDILEGQVLINKEKSEGQIFSIIKSDSGIVDMLKDEGVNDIELRQFIREQKSIVERMDRLMRR
jgi:hypothetical protein